MSKKSWLALVSFALALAAIGWQSLDTSDNSAAHPALLPENLPSPIAAQSSPAVFKPEKSTNFLSVSENKEIDLSLKVVRASLEANERRRSAVVHEVADAKGRQIAVRLTAPSEKDIAEMSEAMSRELARFTRGSTAYIEARKRAVALQRRYANFGKRYRFLLIADPSETTRPVTMMIGYSDTPEVQVDAATNLARFPNDSPVEILVGGNLEDKNDSNVERYGHLLLLDNETQR